MTHLPSHAEPMTFRAAARVRPTPLDALAPFTEALLYGDGPFCFGEHEVIVAPAIHDRLRRRGVL